MWWRASQPTIRTAISAIIVGAVAGTFSGAFLIACGAELSWYIISSAYGVSPRFDQLLSVMRRLFVEAPFLLKPIIGCFVGAVIGLLAVHNNISLRGVALRASIGGAIGAIEFFIWSLNSHISEGPDASGLILITIPAVAISISDVIVTDVVKVFHKLKSPGPS